MEISKPFSRVIAVVLSVMMLASVLPFGSLAATYDEATSGDYYNVLSKHEYKLAPGATETEIILNNDAGTRRQILHVFEVDTKVPTIEVIPGYYGIDKLDPDNLKDSTHWKDAGVTKTVEYYEKELGYNVVGAMNTALAYDSNAPYDFMMWNGVVLADPANHTGNAQTYLAVKKDGTCELRSRTEPYEEDDWNVIASNFGWVVKDGQLVSKTPERTSDPASRSMIGIKADGTLVFCQTDGRIAPTAVGLSNYEEGETMLALGCVNAVNCDGGGSSTFVSKREGESVNTMRSIPSDGAERNTLNSVIIVSNAKATGEFDHAVLSTEYAYYAPGSSATIEVVGVDTSGSPAEVPTEGVSWALSDNSFGSIANGVFTSNGTKGTVIAKMIYNENVVGEVDITVVDPDVFAFNLEETVLPYGKTMTIDFNSTYGPDHTVVCVEGAYTLALSDNNAATLEGNVLKASSDESVKGVDVTATYIPNPALTDVLKVTYGKGSEIVYDFEDGDVSNFLGIDEMVDWAEKVGAAAPIVNDSNFSDETDAETFLSTEEVRNGNYALGVTLDYSAAAFANWSYNMFFNTDDSIVMRDVANGINATTFGMWVYIPEGAAGLAMQLLGYTNAAHTAKTGIHFYFITNSGAKKNLNSATEADIPESRWVYATADLTSMSYFETFDPYGTNGREPSFIRFYIKPQTASRLTFYFDDFTLDYSSAIDDRVLPTITSPSYATADENIDLTNGVLINGDTVAFSAVVADNIKLDNATGKIYVDGNEIKSAKVTGKYLASDGVKLTAGTHTVMFEIKDTLGNRARLYRDFVVAGETLISLSGHNLTNELAVTDSIYYVDINAADLAKVDKVTASIELQTANDWEPEGIQVAKGFKYSYSLNKFSNTLTITLEKNGEEIDANAILASIPVRVWSWDAINHVTGAVITPETQFATGNNPIVTIDYKVVASEVEYADAAYDEYFGTFGGKASVTTMINDSVNPWHYHDDVVTLEDKAATCTEDGYTGRTYCNTCKSVLKWGTVRAQGHKYQVSDGKYKCSCGKEIVTTGLFEIDGVNYYFVAGELKSGWFLVEKDWYYFDKATFKGVDGSVPAHDCGITGYNFNYEFDNGKLLDGVWHINPARGKRYYYGPEYYGKSLREIDGEMYYFNNHGYVQTGTHVVKFHPGTPPECYYFGEDGALTGIEMGPKLVEGADGNTYFIEDGLAQKGLVSFEGNYYYFDIKTYAAQSGSIYIATSATNGLLSPYTYEFGADFKMLQGVVEKEDASYYYVNGKKYSAGLVQIDGDIYLAGEGGKILTGVQYVGTSAANGLLAKGYNYEFGADGKLLNGVVEKNGAIYYYNKGRVAAAGVVKVGDDYYCFPTANGKAVVNAEYKITSAISNNLLPNVVHKFGADGKLVKGFVEENGKLYYYSNGRKLVLNVCEIDGDIYYIGAGAEVLTGVQYVGTSACNGILAKGYNYEFGADGKLLDGFVEKADGLYYYVNGKAVKRDVCKIDGDIYFITDGGKVLTGVQYVGTSTANGVLPKCFEYEFGADGKLLNGFVEKADGIYYYVNGKPVKKDVCKIDGEIYFIAAGGKVLTGVQYVGTSTANGILAKGYNYEFGADGKLLNGFVEKADGIYYYESGKPVKKDVCKIDGEIYFIAAGGKVLTGVQYVGTSTANGVLAKGYNYEFGKDGKLLNGIVDTDNGLYYYEQGKRVMKNICEIDGDIYFIGQGGKVLTGNQYVGSSVANGLLPWGANYVFGADGKLVKA